MEFKLKKSVKNRWLKALRNGEYKQGKSALCSIDEHGKDRFCCLGVLADIEIDAYWIKEGNEWVINGRSIYLERDIIPKDIQRKLAEMNDGSRPFKYIANWIEKNL